MPTELLSNFGLLSLGAFVLFIVGSRADVRQSSLFFHVVVGLVFGGLSVLVIDYPVTTSDGATFDTRAGPAILSGFFGGPVGAVITGVMGGLARYEVGGPMAVGGALSVSIYAASGIVLRLLYRRLGRTANALDCLGLAAFGSVCVLPAFFIDQGLAFGLKVLSTAWPYWLTGNFASTVTLGVLYIEMQRRLTISEQLARAVETSSLATSSARMGVWRHNFTTDEVFWDDRNFEIFGISKASFTGSYEEWLACLHPRDREAAKRVFEDARSRRAHYWHEFRIVRPDGSVRVIRAHGMFRGGQDGMPEEVIGLNYDVTEERERQADLERLSRELEENLQQVQAASEAKSEFLARMSHEFRTPLNAIIGFSQVVEQRMRQNAPIPEFADYIRDIRASGEHLLGLVNGVLDISRIEHGSVQLELEPLHPRDAVVDALRTVRSLARGAGLRLRGQASRDLPMVKADEGALRQCLLNLLSNAIKYSQPGGVVGLSARVDGTGNVRFAVWDEGSGIPADQIAELGQPFHQIGDVYRGEVSGVGLGLAIAKGLVTEMDGELVIDSALGQGTRATICLPAQRETVVPLRAAAGGRA